MTFRDVLRRAVIAGHEFIRDCLEAPPAPGPLTVTQLSQEYVMALKYGVGFPPPAVTDVATRKLKVKVGDADPVVTEYPATATEGFVLVQRGDVVTLTLADTDKDGNVGPDGPPTTFTGADTIAPPAPGALSVTLLDDNAPDA